MTVDDNETAEERPPPGVKAIPRWRSPLRGLWLTSVFGSVLLATLPIVIITGLLSYIAYGPQFGQAIPGDVGWLKLPTFDWPTDPSWLYRLNQGLHVGLGLILIPIVLAKLWSVIPRLFAWPPSRSIAQVLERISLLMLVGGILFEIITGVLNIQYDYIFGFSFYTAHYYGAWVFIAGFLIHIAIKIPRMWTGLRSMSMRDVLRTNRADTTPEPFEPDGLVAENPGSADNEQARCACACRRRRGFRRADHRRADHRRLHPAGRTAAAARPDPRRRPQRLSGQPDSLGGGHLTRSNRRAVAAHPDRRTRSCSSGPSRPDRHAAAHCATSHRLRGRLVDHGNLDRGAAGSNWHGWRACRTPHRLSCDRWSAGARSTGPPCRPIRSCTPIRFWHFG